MIDLCLFCVFRVSTSSPVTSGFNWDKTSQKASSQRGERNTGLTHFFSKMTFLHFSEVYHGIHLQVKNKGQVLRFKGFRGQLAFWSNLKQKNIFMQQ